MGLLLRGDLLGLQVQFGKWADLFKLPAPGPNDRANCPAGGPQFAKTVWRFARVMALAARTQGAQIAEDVKTYEELNSYLDKYIQQLEVRSTVLVRILDSMLSLNRFTATSSVSTGSTCSFP